MYDANHQPLPKAEGRAPCERERNPDSLPKAEESGFTESLRVKNRG